MNQQFLSEVLEGLAKPQKSLSAKWLYDERGSELFEAITRTEDYYLTRTEAAVMEEVYQELPEALGGRPAVAEFGSGAGIKSQRLIEALNPSAYVMIDVAEEFLRRSEDVLCERFPHVDVQGVVGDFSGSVELPASFQTAEHRMGFFPGSTIGNFESGGAQRFLERSRESFGPGSRFLIGADLVKDEAVLLDAYDDSEGVTRQFTLNLLERMKREIGAELDIADFDALSLWNPQDARMELGVAALRDTVITVDGRRFALEAGETIHTENSHKYTPSSFEKLAEKAGWKLDRLWTDEKDWFGVFLLRAG
ncbi:L-histidine N(alpha)-methyltransferase [Parvularcula maris]|uniref:L-histidine N(Alpha)-methyltransferase n=1 Tax=Parvularcula maris TaxID=2965077 RepID=A0A9X2L8Q1_9PROT|nr:L-histidine N(alpha)-methyltransferase [Parvularcula maris]